MRRVWSRYEWVVVLALATGCAGKTLSAGGGTSDAGTGGGETGQASGGTGAAFDAGTAGEAIELEIVDVLAPSAPANGLCSYAPDPTEAALSSGTVDVAFTSLKAYQPVLLIKSLEPVSPTETNRIVLRSATTNVTDASGADVVSLLQGMCSGEATGTKDLAACATGQQLGKGLVVPVVPFTSALDSTEAIGPTQAYGTSSVTLLDDATIALLRAYFANAIATNGAASLATTFHLLTYTALHGSSLGGATVASNVYEFPVTVTFGGLVSNLRTDPSSAVGECLDTTNVPTTAQACVPGQDTPAAVSSLADPTVAACPVPDAG